jgi:hypothetical protein
MTVLWGQAWQVKLKRRNTSSDRLFSLTNNWRVL